MAKQIRLKLSELRKKKEIEERRDILLEDIAQETGLAYSTVSRWISDKPLSLNKDILITFAEYFGVDPLALLEVIEDADDPNYKTALAPAS